MLVYTCKKRFFCAELKKYITINTEIARYENISKLTIKEFDENCVEAVHHYTKSDEVKWFYKMELNSGFFTLKGEFKESEARSTVVESGETILTLKVLSTSERNREAARLNEDLTKFTNKSGKDLYEGHPVVISKKFNNAVTTTDKSKDNRVIGVVVDGSRDGDFLTVASQGTYRVRINGSVKKGDFIASDSDGKVKSLGLKRDSSAFGFALQDGENVLIKAFIFQG